MDPQHIRGSGKVFLLPVKGFLDVEPFELGQGLVKQNLAVEHFIDQALQAASKLHSALHEGPLELRSHQKSVGFEVTLAGSDGDLRR